MNLPQTVALTLAICALSLAACSSASKSRFIDACSSEGGPSRSTCKCVYRIMEKEYTPDVMDRIGNGQMRMPPGFIDEMRDYAMQCDAN